MADWVIVFGSSNVDLKQLGDRLSESLEKDAKFSHTFDTISVQRGQERVEVLHEDALLAEYETEEIACVIAVLSEPRVFRITFYHGTELLSDVLQAISRCSGEAFVDNDHGTILSIGFVETIGIPRFLRKRGRLPELEVVK